MPYSNLGSLYLSDKYKDLQKAEEYCKKAIELFSGDYQAYTRLGVVYGLRDNLEEAIKYLEIAKVLNPSYVSIYKNLGFAYEKKKELLKSEECYLKVIELDQNHAQAHNALGVISSMYIKKATELEPNNLIYNNNLQIIIKKIENTSKQ